MFAAKLESSMGSHLFAIDYSGHLECLLLGLVECFIKGFAIG